jgi:transposase-like protein
MTEIKPERSCPKCNSVRVRRSRSRNLREKCVGIAGAQKFRCRECGLSYFQLGGSVLIVKDIEQAFRVMGRYLAALAAVAVCLYVIRWIVLRLAEPGPSG